MCLLLLSLSYATHDAFANPDTRDFNLPPPVAKKEWVAGPFQVRVPKIEGVPGHVRPHEFMFRCLL